jgi:hypothetical protein
VSPLQRISVVALSIALLLPAASPVAAVYTPIYVDDGDPYGNCHAGDGENYTSGHHNCDGMPDQTQLDQSNAENGYNNANWYDLSGGLTDRPYVRNFSVKNGDTTVAIITDGTVSTEMGGDAGNLGIVIAPFNLCDTDRTPPQTTGCYTTPNRIGITLVYRKAAGQVGYNFTTPNDGNLGGVGGPSEIELIDNAGAAIVVDDNTEIQLEVNLNSLGKSLRWTWMNGIPSYWSTTDLGLDTASFVVHARLASMPIVDNNSDYDTHLCTTVPVSTCNVTRSNSDWLEFQMVLSLDTTMSAAMTGALFATEGVIMGSVDVATDSTTGLPLLKYAAASSHYLHTGETAGDLRYGKMHAVIPASALVQQLGVPSFNDSSAVPSSATPNALFTMVREGTCSGTCDAGDTTFTEWSSGTNGTDGILIDITGLTFSTPKYKVAPKAGVLKAPRATLSGSTYRITLSSGSTSSSTSTANGICKKYGCTVKLFKASVSKVSSTLTYIATKTSLKGANVSLYFTVTKKTTGSTAAKVQRGTRYLVVVRRKDTGALVSSAPVVLP